MHAADFAMTLGLPLNTLVTINAEHLSRMGEGGIFEIGHLSDNRAEFMELLRKWIVNRGYRFCGVWGREVARKPTNPSHQIGEHLHLAAHIGWKDQSAFVTQVLAWTDTARGEPSQRGEIGVSVCGAVQVKHCTKGGSTGITVAAYLGKDEPQHILRYGKRVLNPDKVCRQYRDNGGVIEGKRYGITDALNTRAQKQHGYRPCSDDALRAMARGRARSQTAWPRV